MSGKRSPYVPKKHPLNPKGPFTTGDLARMFSVAPRTVSKWIDKGALEGYRIPLSQDRRVTLDQLIYFLEQNPRLPRPEFLGSQS